MTAPNRPTSNQPFSWCSQTPMTLLALAGLAILSFMPAKVAAQTHGGVQLVQARLISSVDRVAPGQTFLAGLHLKMEPHWHTYWQFPGDAGLPAKVDWKLPEGFSAGPFQWPVPQRIEAEGDLVSYAYENEVLVLVELTAPSSIDTSEVQLGGKASWLVCKHICIPGKADLMLTLPVGEASSIQPTNQALFQKYLARLPQPAPEGAKISWSIAGNVLQLKTSLPEPFSLQEFFPLPGSDVKFASLPKRDDDETFSMEIAAPSPPPSSLVGILAAESPEGLVAFQLPPAKTEPSSTPAAAHPNMNASTTGFVELGGGTGEINLITALFYAFLGGLILNLMPCVLPAISLKIFGFVEQAGESRGRILGFGLAFVAGIFVWFGLMAALAVGLKFAGVDLNWGFLFQHPWALVAMGAIVLVFALNLFGVFEIILPGAAHNALAGASNQKGYAGTFAHGVFATILATPCTAPYLGAALGFAFTQPIWTIPAIFFAIALGMGLPYLLLAANPGWLSFLPKPGAWMERFKQFMGFLLLAVLIWLVWVLGRQRGPDAIGASLILYLLAAVLCWLAGAAFGSQASKTFRRTGWIGAAAMIALSTWVGLAWAHPAFHGTASTAKLAPTTAHPGEIDWKPYSSATLQELLQTATSPIFIDFTADWCWTCKVNERTVLASAEVINAFRAADFAMLQADWTDGDPEITEALKKFRRVGVPLYVIYPSDRSQQPIVLPELITPSIVLEGIQKAIDNRLQSEAGFAATQQH